MKAFLTLTAVNALLLAGIGYGHAAVVKDKTCTHKDGTTYACSAKQEAAHGHIVACGKQWATAKSDTAVKSAGWPAYWHKCSEQMKARDVVGR